VRERLRSVKGEGIVCFCAGTSSRKRWREPAGNSPELYAIAFDR
jgi:hypothetical protein